MIASNGELCEITIKKKFNIGLHIFIALLVMFESTSLKAKGSFPKDPLFFNKKCKNNFSFEKTVITIVKQAINWYISQNVTATDRKSFLLNIWV